MSSIANTQPQDSMIANGIDEISPVQEPAYPMNELPTHSAAAVAPRRRLRRLLISIVLAAASMLAIGVAVPAPASAATSYGTVTGCFQTSSTYLGYTQWGPAMYSTVKVEAWFQNNGYWGWYEIATVQTSSNGCTSSPVVTGYNWRLRLDHTRMGLRSTGVSKYAFVSTTGTYYLGLTSCVTFRA